MLEYRAAQEEKVIQRKLIVQGPVQVGFPLFIPGQKGVLNSKKYATFGVSHGLPYELLNISQKKADLNSHQALFQIKVRPTCFFGSCRESSESFVVDACFEKYPLIPEMAWRNYEHKSSVLTHNPQKSEIFDSMIHGMLDSKDHPAYSTALVSSLLSILTVQGSVPHFPILYQTFRTSLNYYATEALNPAPVQVLVREHIPYTFGERLALAETISPFEVLSVMFQTSFASAFGAKWAHYYQDLSTADIGLLPVSSRFLYYRWNKDFFRVPTFGHVVKLQNVTKALNKEKTQFPALSQKVSKMSQRKNEDTAAARVHKLTKQATWPSHEFSAAFGIKQSELPSHAKVYVL